MSSRQTVKSNKPRDLAGSHARTAKACLQALLATPLATAITMLVIACALIFPALLSLISLNIDASLGNSAGPGRISVFLQSDMTEAGATDVSERLQIYNGIDSIDLITPEQALSEFSESASLGDSLLSLPENPLPYTLLVSLSTGEINAIENLLAEIQGEVGVDAVQFDLVWLQRVQAIAGLLDRLGLILQLLVVVGLIAIVGNTIKLAVANRAQEIRIIKLVGGTDAYIARPFLYQGALLGLGGGLLACLLLGGLFWALAEPARALAQLYGGEFALAPVPLPGYLVLLLLGVGSGWMAAVFASWRNIATINP